MQFTRDDNNGRHVTKFPELFAMEGVWRGLISGGFRCLRLLWVAVLAGGYPIGSVGVFLIPNGGGGGKVGAPEMDGATAGVGDGVPAD